MGLLRDSPRGEKRDTRLPGPVMSRLGDAPQHLSFWVRSLCAAGIAAPILALAQSINRFGVNVPYSDQWELVLLFQKSRGPGLDFSDLWAQHGEQRMVFPRLIMLGLAPLTHWNVKAEMFLNLLLAVALAAILLVLLFRTLRGLGGWTGIPLVSASVLIFSPVQWENWLWGWAISWYLPLLCFFVAVGILAVWPDQFPIWPAMSVAAVAAVIGQYSLFSGTLIWICCLPILLVRRRVQKHTLAWGGMGVASTALYLSNHQPSHWEGFYASLPSLVQDPAPGIRYLLYYLSRPVLDEEPGYLVGAVFVLLFAAAGIYLTIFKRDHFQTAVVWISIGAFSLLWAAMTMVGRLALGPGNAGASRYTTVPILFMVSTLTLLSLALARPVAHALSTRRVILILLAWVSVTSLFLTDYRSEVGAMRRWRDQRLQTRDCLRRASSGQDPCLQIVYPNPVAAFERGKFLKDIGWGGLTKTSGRAQPAQKSPEFSGGVPA